MTNGLPEAVKLITVLLMLLSTRLGSLLLCGFVCLSWRWPFVLKFSELSVKQRGEILLKWSKQSFVIPLRLAFVVLKIMCCYIAFTLVSFYVHHFFINSDHILIFHMIIQRKCLPLCENPCLSNSTSFNSFLHKSY